MKFFSRSEAPEKPPKAVVMRFSAAVAVVLAPDSLTIIPPETCFVNTFFIFLTNFGGHFWLFGISWFLFLSTTGSGFSVQGVVFCYYIRYRDFLAKVLLAVWPRKAYTGRTRVNDGWAWS